MPNLIELEPIVVALMERQAKLNLSSGKFSRMMGVTPPYWCNIRQGKQRAGRKLIDGALRAFPDLAYLYVRELHISNGMVA
jgi:hypothetical protein